MLRGLSTGRLWRTGFQILASFGLTKRSKLAGGHLYYLGSLDGFAVTCLGNSTTVVAHILFLWRHHRGWVGGTCWPLSRAGGVQPLRRSIAARFTKRIYQRSGGQGMLHSTVDNGGTTSAVKTLFKGGAISSSETWLRHSQELQCSG